MIGFRAASGGVSQTNDLFVFDSDTNPVEYAKAPIAGLTQGSAFDVDRRPATKQVYLFVRGQMFMDAYLLDTQNARAAYLGGFQPDPSDIDEPYRAVIAGYLYRADFDPATDRLHVLGYQSGEPTLHWIVDPTTWPVTTLPTITPRTLTPLSTAFAKSRASFASSALYAIDIGCNLYALDPVTQAGFQLVGTTDLTGTMSSGASLDIADELAPGTALALLQRNGDTGIYQIDWDTGQGMRRFNFPDGDIPTHITVSSVGVLFANGFE